MRGDIRYMQLIIILSALLILFALYNVFPNYFARNKTSIVRKKLSKSFSEQTIALTFDDGPNKRYTGQILDILKKYHVKATFFIVAKKANKNPELIKRMINEGHEIAMHSYKHKSAWISMPWETKAEFEKCEKLFVNLKLPMRYFRPPWGTFNAVSLRYALKKGLDVVLWSIEAYDWRRKNTPQNISDIIISRVKDGDIIVLHDSGGAKGAPAHTTSALEILLPKLIEHKYQFVTISEGMEKNNDCEKDFG